ncbi:tetratricopeptide repeat protein [Aliarcobacter cryaerophilus]|uniref:tetratricopeptide repeat protein n=1 Tax=Aliarcobacter cryaerophilus TaxID=28198 RepID=UPI001654BA51|nr:tetratricopeptide repeat protein [Aliarcobacter cryaerophilus]QNM91674.1 tetratricopeptide repeat protein [Aliarcobacter cryaerophilus]
MNQGKTFRLFISSTFSDFSVERRLLQEYVFPEIKKYCNESNLNFQPIDLRWGVSNEAQLDQKTLELCLEEVRESKINPHPNFLIMAGDRYGWIPLPYLIERSEYEAIVTNIEKEEDKELLNIWYKLDENQIPASYILCERKNEFVEYLNWEKVENQLRDILQSSVNKTSLSKNDKEKYFMSATEHEVIEGIFKYLNTTPFQESILQQNKTLLQIDSENVYAYIRNIKSIDESYKNNFIDKDLKNVNKFKKCIKESIDNNNILEVDIELENISKDNMNGSLLYSYETIKNDQKSIFVEIMINNLKKSINLYKNSIKKFSEDELEVFEQKSFKELKMKNFLGREESLQTIDKYINDNNNEALVVYGKSGLGKSSLMAKAIDNAQNKYLNKKIVYRFVGSTVNLTTTSEILISILKELGITEEIRKIKNSKNLQEENEEIKEFYYRVYDHLKSIKEDTIIFIDAIDQLINEDEFLWLPKKLPNNLKIVISALKDDNYKEDSKYLEDINKVTKNTYELKAFDLNNAKELVINLLEKYNRKISQEQMNYVLDIYKNINSPLYLVVAIQDLKDWKSTDKNKTLAKTQKDEIKCFINNLSNIHHHNKEFVKRVFAYISLTGGLSENELLELLSSDKEFLNTIAPETFHTNTTKELPIVIWSRLHTHIKEFLKLENVDNQNVMKFFHREFDNISELTKDEYEHLIELLQNLMFKYQNEDFYSNRWGKLYIEVLKKYYIKYNIYKFKYDSNTKNYSYCKKIVMNLSNENYIIKLLEFLNDIGMRFNELNKSITSYYFESLYFVSKLLYNQNSNKWVTKLITSVFTLSIFLRNNFKTNESIKLQFEIIEILKNLYKKNPTKWNNFYITCLTNQAAFLRNTGNKIESIKFNKEALSITKCLYESDTDIWCYHYTTILNNLAMSLKDVGHVSEAIELEREALCIRKPLHENDPISWNKEYTISLSNLATSLKNNGQVEEAIELEIEALRIRKSMYINDPDIYVENYISSLINLGTSFYKYNKIEETLEYCKEAYEITKPLYESNQNKWSDLFTKSLSSFGTSLESIGKIDEAIKLQKKALEIRKSLYENDSNIWSNVYIKSLISISLSLKNFGDIIQAKIFQEEALFIVEHLYKKDSNIWIDKYLQCLINLSSYYNQLEKTTDSINMLKKALNILRPLNKEKSNIFVKDYLIVLTNISNYLYKIGKVNQAIQYYKEAITIIEPLYFKNFFDYNKIYINILNGLSYCYTDLKKYKEAKLYKRKSANIMKNLEDKE